jgi:hypothetical protein
MSKKAIVLDKVEFQKIVTDLESSKQFVSRGALWQAVEESEWAKKLTPRPLTAQVAMLKAKELNLAIKTVLGKRGNANLATVARGPRKAKRISLEIVESMKKHFPENLHSTIDKAAAGSMKAAIKLNCIECSGFVKKEVALCQIQTCPMWTYRPYKNAANVDTIEN